MNPFKNKNSKSRFEIILILMLVIFLGLSSLTPSTKAIIRDQTISTLAEKDSYVEINNPTTNNGGKDWLIFGDYFLGWREAYLYFNFSDKPSTWTKAEIAIDMYSISQTFNVTASLINDTWNELTINYINKPAHRQVIETFTVAANGVYKIDVTNYIAGRNNISICLNASDYLQNGYVQGRSREGNSGTLFPGPVITWTYPETTEITITNPTSSSFWQELNTYTITWTSVGTIDDVIIQLYKGDTFVEDITYTYTDNDGSHDFYVSSSDNYDGTDYRIKIIDYDDTNVFGYSDYFSINIGNGTITITNPTASTNWFEINTYTITWTSTGTISYVTIELYKGSTYVEDITIIYTDNDGSYNFYVSSSDNYKGTNYKIKIIDYDHSEIYDYSAEFSINIGSGTITVTSPTDSSTWAPGSDQSITWTSTGTITNVDIDIYKANTLMYYVDDVFDIGTYPWTIPSDIEQGTDWEIKVSNSDNANQYDWSEEFTIASATASAIPGYDLLLIGSLSIIATLFIIRKRRKIYL